MYYSRDKIAIWKHVFTHAALYRNILLHFISIRTNSAYIVMNFSWYTEMQYTYKERAQVVPILFPSVV